MPNDDLGSFPMPPQTPVPDSMPNEQDQLSVPSSPATQPAETGPLPINPPTTPAVPETSQADMANTFEETPEELPSIQPTGILAEIEEKPIEPSQPVPQAPIPAEEPPMKRSAAPIIIVVLLVIAGIGLASAAYLSSQTSKLKTQLTEITQTLEKQETIMTPTPSPSIFEIPTPTIATPSASPSATPTLTPTLTVVPLNNLTPLANAASALKIAINKSPNAQLILIKVDNATDPTTSVTKYFFRQDLTTKKYFYVTTTGNKVPEIFDKQIYVTPDNAIPSLNDEVLSNKLGMDLEEAIKTTYTQCANPKCNTAPIKAQYIKTGTGIIWQLGLYTNGTQATPLLIQLDAQTKAILYKSPEFANNK